MRSTKTLFFYFLAAASFIFFSSPVFSRQHFLTSKQSESIKDTFPSNDSTEAKVFEKPDVMASTDASLWIRYLQKGLRKIIEDAASSGVKNGSYRMDVQFIIEKDGSISNVKALSNPLRGPKKAVEKMKQEVEELIQSGPAWAAGEINGEKVRSYHTQPLTFMIAGN